MFGLCSGTASSRMGDGEVTGQHGEQMHGWRGRLVLGHAASSLTGNEQTHGAMVGLHRGTAASSCRASTAGSHTGPWLDGWEEGDGGERRQGSFV